jgi:signal recognition particle GTPase
VLIIDTAGRLGIDEAMMQEIAAVHAAVKPIETLFVVDACWGRMPSIPPKHLMMRCHWGVVLTKLDGDSRGGAALSALNRVPIMLSQTVWKLATSAGRISAKRHGRRRKIWRIKSKTAASST